MNTLTIKPSNLDDPYRDVITSFFTKEFPGGNRGNQKAILDALTSVVIGTKQRRYGPTPDPESLVAIREVLRDSMNAGKAVPILVPWGGVKLAGGSVDIADMMAFKQLMSLSNQVREHHGPGVELRIRLEGYTEQTLYVGEESDKAAYAAMTYMNDLRTLATNLGLTVRFNVESDKVTRTQFRRQALDNAQVLDIALGKGESDRKGVLENLLPDWRGTLTDEMANYYLKVYERFYPGDDFVAARKRLARYLGRSLARYQFSVTGTDGWDKFITAAFVSTPFGRTGRRVYYRTIPECYTNNHYAPWVGRGYFKVRGRECIPAMTGAMGKMPCVKNDIVVEKDGSQVKVAADYVVLDDQRKED